HFIAAQIVKHAEKEGLKPASLDEIRFYQNGVSGVSGEDPVKIGSRDFVTGNLKAISLDTETDPNDETLHSTVYMRYGDRLCARFIFGDTLKDGAVKTIENLKNMGYSIALVSGDGDRTTRTVGHTLGIQNAGGGKLPQDKALFVRGLQKNGKQVAMVGDGVNDAPALVQADLALAVHAGGHLGNAAGGVTLMRGHPEQIPVYLDLAEQVNRKIQQNLVFSLLYNTISIPVAMAGLLTPLVAVSAMLLSSLSVTGNTLLMIRKNTSAEMEIT
ncbi:HAD-IC family P-type ATPase, partial [Thermodesulfobacteriota bacterium]